VEIAEPGTPEHFFEADALFMYQLAYYIFNDIELLHEEIPFQDLLEYVGFILNDHQRAYEHLRSNPELLFLATR
jgi:hypothetical protein